MLVQISSKQPLGTLSERAVRSLRPRTCGRRRARLYAGPREGSAALVPSLGGGSPGPYSSALAMSSEGGEDSCVAAKHKGSHVLRQAFLSQSAVEVAAVAPSTSRREFGG